MSRRDMLAVDGSDQAQYAFEWYLENMYRDGDTVLLIHVPEYHIDVGLPGAMADVDNICAQVQKRQKEIGDLTEGFTNVLRAKHVPFKVITQTGDKPGEIISKMSKEEKANSIIMGTRGLGKLRRTLLGSVSEYVIHHAECPVTVVRRPQES